MPNQPENFMQKNAKDYYIARRAVCMRESVVGSLDKQINLLCDIDKTIALYGKELNAAQYLMCPRLSIPMFKSHKVEGYGYDYKPDWVVQKINLQGAWYTESLSRKGESPMDFFRLKYVGRVIGENRYIIKRIIKEVNKLLLMRDEIIREMSKMKVANARRDRKFRYQIQKASEILYDLAEKTVVLNKSID